MSKKKSFIQRAADKAINLQSKAFDLEHKNILKDDYDNCLLCKHATIYPNKVAELFRSWGIEIVGNALDQFKVVTCQLSDDKYVVNPLHKPGWCKRTDAAR